MNLLVTGAWSDAKNHMDEIAALGHSVVFMQQESDELPCDGSWVEGVIGNGLFLYHPLSCFPNLKYIQLTSAGFDRVDMAEIEKRGIEIHNAKGVYSIPMAEFAVWGVLEIYKKADFFRRNQQKHIWEKNRNLLELYGKTVAVIGCGDVGRECAKRFQAFGCNIIEVHRDLNNLDYAVSTADIVIVTLPLTAQTRHIVAPSKMKSGSILVSISRGAVIDQEDLLHANQLLGALLDVFEDEPLKSDSPLWNKKNYFITPHNSYIGEGNTERLYNVIFQYLRGYTL